MRLAKTCTLAFLLVLAVAAVPALADSEPALDFGTLQGAEAMAGESCNQRTCGQNQFCCNYSCSICAPLGGACTQQICPPVELSLEEELGLTAEPLAAEPAVVPAVAPVAAPDTPALTTPKPEETRLFPGGGQCNQAVCGAGEFCCNWSCSVCAPLGGACLDVYCPPVS